MNATLIAKMADSVVEAARIYIDQRESVLLKRIAELEAREPIPGPPGKDALPVDVKAVTELTAAITFEKVMAAIPPPINGKDGKDGAHGKDGVDGINGKDGDPGTVGPAGKDATFDLDAVVAEVVKAIPVPKDGINGKDGKDAEPIDTDAVIKAVVAQIPTPKDGEPGKDAEINTKTLVDQVLALVPIPKDGKDGSDGKDAPPVDAKLIVKEVLAQIPEPVPGRDGMPGTDGANGTHGKDGRDAFNLEDMSIEQLKDGRTVRFKFQSGERILQKDIRFDVPLYRRTYMREGLYEKDDMVTFHNEVWIAVTKEVTEPPGALSKQWQLAIRKGRDSKPVKI